MVILTRNHIPVELFAKIIFHSAIVDAFKRFERHQLSTLVALTFTISAFILQDEFQIQI